MSISKGKLTLLSLLISTSLLSSTVYATEPSNQPVAAIEKSTTKTFPETLQALIDAPGKKDELIIPMSKKVYEDEIVSELNKGWSERKDKIKASLIDVSYVNDLALVKFNTKVKETYISISDKASGFSFSYNFANGYLLSTDIYKYIRDDENVSENLDYLSNVFDKYLTDKGFTKKTSLFHKITELFSKETEYHSGNHIVVVNKPNSLMFDKVFSVTMKNKEIEDNLDAVMKGIKEANLQYEYQGLSKILK
jgi:hypothetical protein